MSLYTPSQLEALRVLCATLPSIVGLVTVSRLWIKQPHRWWWDDFFVTFGVMAMITQQGVLWELSIFQPPTLPVFYAVVILSQTQVWSARCSIMASVVRIAPTARTRIISQVVFGLFGLFYLITLAQFIWVCQSHLEADGGVPHCNFTIQVPIYQLCAAMTADSLLITLPINTIRRLRGDSNLRRRLVFIFAASCITTSVSLIQATLNLLDVGFGVFIAAELECWISLLVCNLGVIVNAVLRYWHPEAFTSIHEGSPRTGHSGIANRTQDIEISVIKFQSRHQDPIEAYHDTSAMFSKEYNLTKMETFSPDVDSLPQNSFLKFDPVAKYDQI